MKKYMLFSFAIVFFSIQTIAQDWVNISSTFNSRIDDIYFINDNTGWLVVLGDILKTTDGGVTWETQFSQPGLYFRSIEFLDSQRGFAGTLDGVFLKTIDGGETWEDINTTISPSPPGICGISHTTDGHVFASGLWASPAYVIKSEDEGENWAYINMDAYASRLVDIHFLDNLNGFVTGRSADGGTILYTSDGGETWTEVHNTLVPGEIVWKIQVVNPEMFVASVESFSGAGGKILISKDSGNTWEEKQVPTADGQIQAIGFLNEQTGWVGGYNQTISETNDGGETWENLGIGLRLNRIFFVSENLAYACGLSVLKWGESSTEVNSKLPSKEVSFFEWQVSPNIGNGKFKVDLKLMQINNVDIELYSFEGRLIKSIHNGRLPTGEYRFQQLDDLPAGTYIVGLQLNEGLFSEKIVVK